MIIHTISIIKRKRAKTLRTSFLILIPLYAMNMRRQWSFLQELQEYLLDMLMELAIENADRSNGTLIMATNSEFPPYEYMEGGKIVGIDVDMMNAVCDKLGYELKIEDMAFDSIIAAVQSGKATVGVAGMSVTPARQENVRFSDSYTVTQMVVMVRK